MKFTKVALINKPKDNASWQTLLVIDAFLRAQGLRTYIYADFAVEALPHCVDMHTITTDSELVVTIGGDGTLLFAARRCAAFSLPIFGINEGHIGCLTAVTPDDAEQALLQILHGEYHETQHQLIAHNLGWEPNNDIENFALNDIVVKPYQALMVEFVVSRGAEILLKARADGVIISTAIGSTGYALSSGGPIVDRRLQVFVICAISPHSLGNRAIITAEEALNIYVTAAKCRQLAVYCDGHLSRIKNTPSRIEVSPYGQYARLLYTGEYSPFAVTSARMHRMLTV